jgi:hypothetical protein
MCLWGGMTGVFVGRYDWCVCGTIWLVRLWGGMTGVFVGRYDWCVCGAV